MKNYYWVGIVFVLIFCAISWWVTKSPWPFAMAKRQSPTSNDGSYSASLTQMLVFLLMTVFAYTTVFAARAFGENGGVAIWANLGSGNTWLAIPGNLLMLMGISVGTAVAGRAIKVQQENANLAPADDKTSLTTNADGKTDLVKIQMLIWTVVAVFVYIRTLWVFMDHGCYATAAACPKEWGNSLPDIDTAFLALLGISQAGHVANQLSQNSTSKPNENKKDN